MDKEEFRKKVAEATDKQLETGYGSLKKKHRVALETLASKREAVEDLLEHPTLVKARDDAEQAKLQESLTSWQLQTVEQEQARRFRENTAENDTEFNAEV